MEYFTPENIHITCMDKLKTPLSPFPDSHRGLTSPGHLGPVVQGWVSANRWLRFNLLFWFVYLYAAISFKTSKSKITIDPDKISGKIF